MVRDLKKDMICDLHLAWQKGVQVRNTYGWHSNPFTCGLVAGEETAYFESISSMHDFINSDAFNDVQKITLKNSKNNKQIMLKMAEIEGYNVHGSFIDVQIAGENKRFDLGL